MTRAENQLVPTQVSLTLEQRLQLEARGSREMRAVDELVREAVDLYLATGMARDVALASTFGSLPELDVRSRDEWNRA